MKKLLLMLTSLSMLLAGCSKDGEVDLGQFDYPHSLLIGSWQLTQINDTEWLGETTLAHFWKDGKYKGQGVFGDAEGTYRLSGKEVICYIEKKEFVRYGVQSISGTEALLTIAIAGSSAVIRCKKLTGNPDDPVVEVEEVSPSLLDAFEYTDGLIFYGASEFMYDGKSMGLYFGLRHSKVWLGIADKVGDEYVSHYEWTGGDDVKESITINLPYGEQITCPLTRITSAYGIKNTDSKFAFAVNIGYGGYGLISRLLIDGGSAVMARDLDENNLFKIREWTDDYFIVYYDWASASYPGAGWSYSYAGEEKYQLSSVRFLTKSDYYPLSLETALTRTDSQFSKINCKTGAELWMSTVSLPDVPEDAHYNRWNVDEKGSVWTFSVNITLYSGENIVRKFTVNIETGEIGYI